MIDLDHFTGLVRSVQGLVTVSTSRADGSIQSSLVNAAVMAGPFDGGTVVAFVTGAVIALVAATGYWVLIREPIPAAPLAGQRVPGGLRVVT